MRAIHFALYISISLGLWTNFVEAAPRVVSLSLSGKQVTPLKVFQDTPIKIHNTFEKNLHDFKVIKPPVSKEILSVAELISGQSFDLYFPKVGDYEICFSREKNESQTCLQVNVVKRTLA